MAEITVQSVSQDMRNSTGRPQADLSGLNTRVGNVEKSLKKVTGVINVVEYGYVGDGQSHPLSASYSTLSSAQVDYPSATALTDEKDWCAIQQACNIAMNTGYGGTIKFPYGKAIVNKQIISKNVSWIGDSTGTEIHFQNFGNGSNEVSAVVFDWVTGLQRNPVIQGIMFTGDGGWYNKGVRGTYLNGVEVTGDCVAQFVNCVFKYFNKGVIWSNNGGWIVHERCEIQENYYGIYCKRNNGDYRLNHTNLKKNNFANFATNASTGFQGLVMNSGHCAFSPYGFYCEPDPSNATNGNQNRNQFMRDVKLDHVRFESIGNGVIYSDPSQGVNPMCSGLIIINAGFAWDSTRSTYTLATMPRDYVIDIGTVDGGNVQINSGAFYFVKGDVNIVRVRNLLTSISVIGSEASKCVDVVAGTGTVNQGQNYSTARYDGMVVPKSLGGQFNQLVTNGSTVTFAPYFMNNPNKRFMFFVMSDGGGAQPFGIFFHDGTTIVPVTTAGTSIAYGTTNPNTTGKLNLYVSSAGVIGINNQYGSDRTVSITVLGFY